MPWYRLVTVEKALNKQYQWLSAFWPNDFRELDASRYFLRQKITAYSYDPAKANDILQGTEH
jgi:hypothetical protein